LTPEINQLVEATIVTPVVQAPAVVSDFSPRIAKRKKTGTAKNKNSRRYSPESKKVGDAGERAVLKHERQKLLELGRLDLADKVRWHPEHNEFSGWDITSFDEHGDQLFIEVKASAGKQINAVCLTENEWNAAQHARHSARYHLYFVTHALSAAPRIERLCNPLLYVESGSLTIEPIAFELRLIATPQDVTETNT
jgi:hypothetical protein